MISLVPDLPGDHGFPCRSGRPLIVQSSDPRHNPVDKGRIQWQPPGMRIIPFNHEPGRLPPTLAKIPFLATIEGTTLDGMLARSSVLEFFPGDIILKEGEQSEDFCILLKGAVRVVKGTEEVARIDESGALIGELALLNGEARSATVEGLNHGFCLRVESGFLDRLSSEQKNLFFAALYRFVARLLGERLADCTAKLAACEKELATLKGSPVDL